MTFNNKTRRPYKTKRGKAAQSCRRDVATPTVLEHTSLIHALLELNVGIKLKNKEITLN